MVPPRPPETCTGSEKRVFGLLGAISTPSAAAALSSLNLSENEFQRWGEIDFVVVTASGLLAIEVKGGEVSCSDGIWRFEDRWGRVVEKRTAPISQAQAGYSSLLKLALEPKLGKAMIQRRANGFCAVLPFTSKAAAKHFLGTPEMPESLVATSEDCVSVATFERFLKRVYKYWKSKSSSETIPWSQEETASVVKALRPSFDRVPPLSLSLNRLRTEQLELTEDQYDLLDYFESAPRVLCEAAAGTGKTFLAVECLRRSKDGGALLLTGTANLAASIRASSDVDPTRVLAFDELLRTQELDKVKTLIVDEGQQITNREALSRIDSLLQGGLDSGRWRWFSDPHHQVTRTSLYEPEAARLLHARATVTPPLRKNCRNTPQIVRSVEFATGLTIGSVRVTGAGPEVVYAQSQGKQERLEEVAKEVRKWLADESVRPGHIAFLSPTGAKSESVRELAARCGHKFMPWVPGWDKLPEYPKVFASATIEEFRGLEVQFVVLCDVGLEPGGLDGELYLGLTRANFAAVVECEPAARIEMGIRRSGATR
jgi:hypothetical protein